MRNNIAIVTTLGLMCISGLMSVSAYTPYYNNYSTGARSNSYTYVQGCYTYSYDAYTRITSLIGSNCATNTTNTGYNTGYNTNYNNNSSYYPTYSSNTYPTYSSNTYSYSVPATSYSYYTQPTTYSYYTQPNTYTSYSPYYTYGYDNGYWNQGGSNGFLNGGYNNSNYVPTPTTGCYYVSGYYACY